VLGTPGALADWFERVRSRARDESHAGRAMLKVHHLNNSRSQRILWLLEELGTPYEIVKYQRMSPMPVACLS
jgi:glutathione S-transferase